MGSPAGLLRAVEPVHSIWIGHAGQNVTAAHVDDIELIPGVDILKVLTRYSFLVAVPPQFDDATVKRAVENVVCPNQENVRLRRMVAGANRLYTHWVISQDPDGRLLCLGASTRGELNDKEGALGSLWKAVTRG